MTNDNRLIIVEGCSGSGKSSLVSFLSQELDIPVYQRFWYHIDLSNIWSEYCAISQLYNTNLKLIQDRAMVSFCYYHRDYIPALYWFAENLLKWDYARVIFLYSNPEKIMCNVKGRNDRVDKGYIMHKIQEEILGMREMLGYISEKIVLEYEVKEYDNEKSWMQDILNKL